MINYYTVLEVEPTASSVEIKAAFRRLTLQYHPDRNPDIHAGEKFSLIHKAYGILADDDLRRKHDLQLAFKVPFPEQTQPVVYITDRIWMKISRRKVKSGETFSIIIRSFKRSKDITLEGVDGFEVVNYYSQIMVIQDRPVREVLYVLRNHKPGTYTIGPARMNQGRYEYISGSYEVEVTDEVLAGAVKPNPKPLYYMVAAFIIFLTFNLGYYMVKGAKDEERQQEMLQLLKETHRNTIVNNTRLMTGNNPYSGWFGKEFEPIDGNALLIKNGLNKDAVVLLYDINNDKTLGNYYIRAADSLMLQGVPIGNYQLKVLSGAVWDVDRIVADVGVIGIFAEDKEYYQLKGKGATLAFHRGNIGAQLQINTDATKNKKCKAEEITKQEFFKRDKPPT